MTDRDEQGEQPECSTCDSQGWVCENHLDRPWDGVSNAPNACHCGGAGAPCPDCNPCDRENPPRMAPGTRIICDGNGWRH